MLKLVYPATDSGSMKNADARQSSDQRPDKDEQLRQSEGGTIIVGRRKEQASKRPRYEEDFIRVQGRRRDVRKGVKKMCHLEMVEMVEMSV